MEEKDIAYKIATLPFNMAFRYFCENKEKLSDEYYWTILRALWIQDGTCNELWKSLFFCKRKREHKVMKSSDRQFLRKLPKKITVYRACNSKEEEDNFNWTLSKDFAVRLHKNYIAEKTINKKQIFAYFNSRKEDEIIIKPDLETANMNVNN